MDQRTIARSAIAPSLLGLASSPQAPVLRPGLDPAYSRALVAAADAAGVTYFDASTSGSPASAEQLLGLSLSSLPPRERVIATRVEPRGPTFEDLRTAVVDARTRLGVERIGIGWLSDALAPSLHDPTARESMRRLVEDEPMVGVWGVRFGAVPTGGIDVGALKTAGVQAVAFPFHLLNATETVPLASELADGGLSVVALDPHAGGLLNGRRLESAWAPPGRTPPRPVVFSALARELAPVTRLGFLTKGRVRTLGQAALQFVWQARGVVAALPSTEDAAELAEWVAAFDRPPLSEEDRSKVVGLAVKRTPGSVA